MSNIAFEFTRLYRQLLSRVGKNGLKTFCQCSILKHRTTAYYRRFKSLSIIYTHILCFLRPTLRIAIVVCTGNSFTILYRKLRIYNENQGDGVVSFGTCAQSHCVYATTTKNVQIFEKLSKPALSAVEVSLKKINDQNL